MCPGNVRVAVEAHERAREDGGQVREAFAEHELTVTDAVDAETDVLTLVGETRFFLSRLAELPDPPPVLLLSNEGLGVLAEAQAGEAEEVARALAEGRSGRTQTLRMECEVGDERWLALNEAAVLPQQNGTFLDVDVKVDGELLWHDRGDGTIVCTPTGSTAYALSAGGPAVLSAADVLTVVPVCSEEDHPPIVSPSASMITLANPESGSGVELVVDGHRRVSIDEDVTIKGTGRRLTLVRLSEREHGHLLGRVRLKREIGSELADAPPSARFIYKLLEYEGPMTPSEIARQSGLTSRTVRSSLGKLTELGYVVKRASLRDARTEVYDVAERAGLNAGERG
ncbi:hypothetical protein BRD56_06070 [Thermoplasmatales archaeon SW_10_69_26]|jgi:NAD+ kinase|nr:MAG: hypothetical protein BRD56_06070 [Thermoplasmatales archaeon SW_10_69_26]